MFLSNSSRLIATVLFASLYATTGKRLSEAGESSDGVYLSGPRLVTKHNLPTAEWQRCSMEGFPTCDDDSKSKKQYLGGGQGCRCTDRTKVVIAGVTHGHAEDHFWDEVYAGMYQAASDFSIDLRAPRLAPKETDDAQYTHMMQLIQIYCSQGGIDGIFVTLPNVGIAKAVKTYCIDEGIPAISINAGGDLAVQYGFLHHIGQVEFRAGKLAGERMMQGGGGVTRAACLMHIGNHAGLTARCEGMQAAFEQQPDRVLFLGSYDVSKYTLEDYFLQVESLFDGHFEGAGALVTGPSHLPWILEVQRIHPALQIGSFDVHSDLYDAMDKRKVQFGIDQNAYLQGYLPIPFLTWYASTGEAFLNRFIESGPRFVTERPSKAQEACQDVFFQACTNYTDPAALAAAANGLVYSMEDGPDSSSSSANLVLMTVGRGHVVSCAAVVMTTTAAALILLLWW